MIRSRRSTSRSVDGALHGSDPRRRRAARFDGEPKGLERVGGARIIDRVALALRGRRTRCCSSRTIRTPTAGSRACAPWPRRPPRTRGAWAGSTRRSSRAGRPCSSSRGTCPSFRRRCCGRCGRCGEAGADVVAAGERLARAGVEPLCAYYAPACIAADRASARARRPARDRRSSTMCASRALAGERGGALRRSGATLHEREHTGRPRARGAICLDRRCVAIIGRKHQRQDHAGGAARRGAARGAATA